MEHFENLHYSGASTLVRGQSASSKGKTMIVTKNSSMPKWEGDILEKIRSLILAVPVPLKEVFKQFDTDGSGKLSSQEFRNGIRKLGLGLTSREIDQLMIRIDTNMDSQIDYHEFISKMKGSSEKRETEKLIKERGHNKLAELK